MGRPTKRDAILDGAMTEFLARGYAGTSMDRIAAAAKVSKATVYSHFQDKESLFVQLIERLVRGKFQGFFDPDNFQVLPQGKSSQVLRGLAAKLMDIPASDPQFLDFMRIILGESGRFPQLARTFVRTVEASAFRAIAHYFATCEELQVDDPEATARIFVGAIVHFNVTQYMLHGHDILPMERDRLIDALIELVICTSNQ
jgi:AcrR family transcriptional regulator